MLDSCDLIAFVPTVDLGRARSFYADTAGSGPDGAVRVCVRLRGQRDHAARDAGRDGPRRRATRFSAGNVPDIAAAVIELAPEGSTFERFEWMAQDELGIWTTPDNSRVAWFKDPDGNTLSVTQFAR